jgi:hypothetical protein
LLLFHRVVRVGAEVLVQTSVNTVAACLLTPAFVLQLLATFVCLAQNLFDTCVDANNLVAPM